MNGNFMIYKLFWKGFVCAGEDENHEKVVDYYELHPVGYELD